MENDRFVNDNVALVNKVSRLEGKQGAGVYDSSGFQCADDMFRGCSEGNIQKRERTLAVMPMAQTLHQVVTKRGGGLQGGNKEGSEKQNISAWQYLSISAPLRPRPYQPVLPNH